MASDMWVYSGLTQKKVSEIPENTVIRCLVDTGSDDKEVLELSVKNGSLRIRSLNTRLVVYPGVSNMVYIRAAEL